MNLLLLQKIQQRREVLPEYGRLQPFQPLNAIRYDAFAPREHQPARDVQREAGHAVEAIATRGTVANGSPAAQRRRETVDHDPPPTPQRLAGTPHVRPAHAVENGVHARAGQPANLGDEILRSEE